MTFKKIIFIFLVALGALYTNIVSATCGMASNGAYQYKYYNFGDVVVQRDTPVGTVLATLNTGSFSNTATGVSGDTLFGCDTPWTYRWTLAQFTTLSSVSGTYNTNIPGVGIRISNSANGYIMPYDQAFPALIYAAIIAGIKAELIKTSVGGVGAGSITNGSLAIASIVGWGNTLEVDMGTNKIIPVMCTIKTPNLLFPIGDIPAASFGATVGTTPAIAQNTQNLGLDCDPQANINVSLSGTQNPDVGTTSVLALSGQGSAGVAKGVGVQIVYNGTPLTLGNRIVLKQSAGGLETFPLVARYYQTKTAVTTGTANANATLNLTYQ